jgi:hypothetical protein
MTRSFIVRTLHHKLLKSKKSKAVPVLN